MISLSDPLAVQRLSNVTLARSRTHTNNLFRDAMSAQECLSLLSPLDLVVRPPAHTLCRGRISPPGRRHQYPRGGAGRIGVSSLDLRGLEARKAGEQISA